MPHDTEHSTRHHHHEGGPSRSREMFTAVTTLASSMAEAMDNFVGTLASPEISRRRHRRPLFNRSLRRRCGCEEERCHGCSGSSCHCECCIGDVDLVVYTRFGEQRVVPIRIENTRAREREVKLELSGFRTKGGGDTSIDGQLVGDTEFTLKPCEERDVILVVDLSGTDGGDNKRVADRREVPDVDDCVVAVADLRIEGCDLRPVRIAVAVLPRDCGHYTVECGCGCC
jgi:hypothetical protein